MYLPREIEPLIKYYRKQFKVVLITGPRQVGKTTLLKHDLPKSFEYISLDNLELLRQATTDSKLLFKEHPIPLVIDEIQYAPELFLRIKNIVDNTSAKGQLIITGSQTFQLMKQVTESLAGRIGILEMNSLSLREYTKNLKHKPYIPELVNSRAFNEPDDFDLWQYICRGSMPELLDQSIDAYHYYSSYVKTYIERDVRDIINVKDDMSRTL